MTLTVAERGALECLASTRSPVDARTLLAYFVGDLVASEKSGGSDERLRAHDWLDRRFGPQWYADKHYGIVLRPLGYAGQEGGID